MLSERTMMRALCCFVLVLAAASDSKGTCKRRYVPDGECDVFSLSNLESVETSAFVQSRLNFKGKAKDWVIEFEDSCAEEGLKSFCQNLVGSAKCMSRGRTPDHGRAFVSLVASEQELQELKGRDGQCKISSAGPNTPFSASETAAHAGAATVTPCPEPIPGAPGAPGDDGQDGAPGPPGPPR
mmetsp:Transcript_100997/g.184256  ORF Transcript_100997/g.184256 Transcript_100997/m.184256 type:complete len:183 (+) Transcript_100997:79-627(+)